MVDVCNIVYRVREYDDTYPSVNELNFKADSTFGNRVIFLSTSVCVSCLTFFSFFFLLFHLWLVIMASFDENNDCIIWWNHILLLTRSLFSDSRRPYRIEPPHLHRLINLTFYNDVDCFELALETVHSIWSASLMNIYK